ncbi:sensor domain-containing diguanylate cyclase [Noviherbaspirillum galbum]|uniref:diguanylate cyclase n=1 Tax=Noviherbaspirillum galbum TaxID=2709383 RepID=A0A6B3SHJ3_9BURK|nr:sensor domain-containing diguanylate cyclase [Noviherbaspirillum galbum]NEX60337.1 diguanylate cyclase [Noviherbaspirillum galbum]
MQHQTGHVPDIALELEKYRRVFRAMPDYATFSHLKTGFFIDVNPGFERLTGYRRDEVLGRTAGDIDLWVNKDHRAGVVAALNTTDSVTIETQFRDREGTIIDVEASCAIFNFNGEPLLVAIVRDITLRKRQEQELQKYRNTLENLVAQRTADLEAAMQKLSELAVHDELTGVGNRRDLNFRLDQEYQSFKRLAYPCCIAVFDLDSFKEVNDRFGHQTGDEVIKAFAAIIQREMRATDYLARYGGDEFVLLLKGASPDVAQAALNRMREAVLQHDWASFAPGIRLTASIGMAAFDARESADASFRRADKALYAAKHAGGNQIVMADQHP